jgi:hypothetical protein
MSKFPYAMSKSALTLGNFFHEGQPTGRYCPNGPFLPICTQMAYPRASCLPLPSSSTDAYPIRLYLAGSHASLSATFLLS